MYELALFSGAGGGILGGILCGHTCIGAVEVEEYPREVLKQRQRDGILPRFPLWDDIRTFTKRNRECRRYFKLLRQRHIRKNLVISGGFPCQDISAAGKGAGIEGSRSGLWGEMARIIGEVRPAAVLVENSPLLVSRGLAVVLGDLAELGYDARWCVLGADDAGAPHRRKRIWVLAHTEQNGCNGFMENARSATLGNPQAKKGCRGDTFTASIACISSDATWWLHDPADLPDTDETRFQAEGAKQQTAGIVNDRTGSEWPTQPRLGRVAHGVANRVDRLKAIGNGQVPAVVKLAWDTLAGTLDAVATTY